MLNRNGGGGHPCHLLILGKRFSIPLLSIMLTVNFLCVCECVILRTSSFALPLVSHNCILFSSLSVRWAAWSLPLVCVVQGSVRDLGRIYRHKLSLPSVVFSFPGYIPSISSFCSSPKLCPLIPQASKTADFYPNSNCPLSRKTSKMETLTVIFLSDVHSLPNLSASSNSPVSDSCVFIF